MSQSTAVTLQPGMGPQGQPEEWWSADYLGGERVVEGVHYGWLMRDHLARYEAAAPYCRGKRVLDVATGTGYGANILRKAGAAEVVAVDREQRALDYGAGRYGTDGLQWVNADAYAVPFGSEFDVVVSFETIEHLKEPERFVIECKRLVKPGGLFVVSTPLNVGGPKCSDFHELEFTREEFESLLARHFPRFELFGQRRELSMTIKPLGGIPDAYFQSHIQHGRGNHNLFTLMDRLNKAPNLMAAWAMGLGDDYRRKIRPIDEPTRQSWLLKSHYFIMIAVCQTA
jgi:ubiquinone/menaquinone biosynthesis C-methylase UbiE